MEHRHKGQISTHISLSYPSQIVDRRVWKRALHDTKIPCRSGFYTRRNPEIPKPISY